MGGCHALRAANGPGADQLRGHVPRDAAGGHGVDRGLGAGAGRLEGATWPAAGDLRGDLSLVEVAAGTHHSGED